MRLVGAALRMSIRLFEEAGHAKLYSKYRPSYPQQLTDTIVQYVKEGGGKLDIAIDVACGNGQSTFPLCPHFSRVIGVDVSKSQLDNIDSTGYDNLEFRQGDAQDLPFIDSSSVDLVTAALALHWFNFEQFYTEVKRVLCPGGAVAAYGIGNVVLDNPDAHNIFLQFYKTLGPHWNPRRKHVENHYKDIPWPFSDVKRLDSTMFIRKKMPISGLIGYLESYSSYQSYRRENPQSTLLQEVQQSMEEAYRKSQSTRGDMELEAVWPIFLLLGRNA